MLIGDVMREFTADYLTYFYVRSAVFVEPFYQEPSVFVFCEGSSGRKVEDSSACDFPALFLPDLAMTACRSEFVSSPSLPSIFSI